MLHHLLTLCFLSNMHIILIPIFVLPYYFPGRPKKTAPFLLFCLFLSSPLDCFLPSLFPINYTNITSSLSFTSLPSYLAHYICTPQSIVCFKRPFLPSPSYLLYLSSLLIWVISEHLGPSTHLSKHDLCTLQVASSP